MDQNQLLLLGMLKSQASHGYQLMDFVERNLSHMTHLKKATAYYELKRLEKQGWIQVRVEQEGGRPPRQVYSLTPAGSLAFTNLLREGLKDSESPSCTADMSLVFMDCLSQEEALALLEQKLAGLRERLAYYQMAPSHGGHPAVDLALSHVVARLRSEVAWFEDLIGRLKQESQVAKQ